MYHFTVSREQNSRGHAIFTIIIIIVDESW